MARDVFKLILITIFKWKLMEHLISQGLSCPHAKNEHEGDSAAMIRLVDVIIDLHKLNLLDPVLKMLGGLDWTALTIF